MHSKELHLSKIYIRGKRKIYRKTWIKTTRKRLDGKSIPLITPLFLDPANNQKKILDFKLGLQR